MAASLLTPRRPLRCTRTTFDPLLSSSSGGGATSFIAFSSARPAAAAAAAAAAGTGRATQVRHATLIKRPKRPYTFTQLVTLSDGSAFLQRTTSPAPVYRSTKDLRNAPLWNPSSDRLLRVEDDEAGTLAAFRDKFGRGWDAADRIARDEVGRQEEDAEAKKDAEPLGEDNLLELISGFGQDQELQPRKKGKGKKK